MDRQLMKDFYSNMHEDPIEEIMKESEECKEYEELRKEFGKRDSDLFHYLDAEGKEKYELLSDAANQMLSCIAQTLYLRGAEDREKMLR